MTICWILPAQTKATPLPGERYCTCHYFIDVYALDDSAHRDQLVSSTAPLATMPDYINTQPNLSAEYHPDHIPLSCRFVALVGCKVNVVLINGRPLAFSNNLGLLLDLHPTRRAAPVHNVRYMHIELFERLYIYPQSVRSHRVCVPILHPVLPLLPPVHMHRCGRWRKGKREGK